HGDGGVAGSAEDGVVEEEQHDGAAAAQRDAGVAAADVHDLLRCAHQVQQFGGIDQARHADEDGDGQADGDGLDSGDGGAFGIFFADAAGDHGGGGEAEAQADGED